MQFSFSTLIAGLSSALVFAAPASAQTARSKVTLAPHRAVYDITLERANSGSGVADMTGRMVYELTGSACEGWTQNMRFVTRLSKQEGATEVNDLRSSSWEDAAATRFRFSSSQYRDEQMSDATQGDATRGKDEVQVELTKPKKSKRKLEAGVFFPVQHSIALLEAAHAGKTIFVGDLFDGSEEGEKVYDTTSAIGKQIAPGAVKSPATLKSGDQLDRLASWPVSISYFEPNSNNRDAVPSYELSFRFYDNGVSSKLHIDYGEFAIRGELKELAFLDAGKCDAVQPKR